MRARDSCVLLGDVNGKEGGRGGERGRGRDRERAERVERGRETERKKVNLILNVN